MGGGGALGLELKLKERLSKFFLENRLKTAQKSIITEEESPTIADHEFPVCVELNLGQNVPIRHRFLSFLFSLTWYKLS